MMYFGPDTLHRAIDTPADSEILRIAYHSNTAGMAALQGMSYLEGVVTAAVLCDHNLQRTQ